jgi:hypothetical protein
MPGAAGARAAAAGARYSFSGRFSPGQMPVSQ